MDSEELAHRELRLTDALAELRGDIASQTPPDEIATKLRAAFARRTRGSRRWEKVNLFGLPLAIAAILALVSWTLRVPLPTIDPTRSPAVDATMRGEIGTAFFPLVPLNQIAQNTDTRVIPVSLPRTALASFGLPIDPARAAEPVAGEMLVTETGSPLAVRFILAASTY